MDTIRITDLEVAFHIGVTDAEQAQPQRLLISIELQHDVTAAATTDDLTKTIDYFAVSQRVRRFGDDRRWRLIEKLASDLAAMILEEFAPATVSVEVKKFVIPASRHVSVSLTRSRSAGTVSTATPK